jgi:hypothetical protein
MSNTLTKGECQILIDADHDWKVAIMLRPGQDKCPGLTFSKERSARRRTFKRATVSVFGENHPAIRKEFITMYETGDFCKLHRDSRWRHEHPGYHAVDVWITPLNDNYEGGNIFVDGEYMESKVGEPIKFNCRLRHEITKVTSGTRHSLISWIFEED